MALRIILSLLAIIILAFVITNGTFMPTSYNPQKDTYQSDIHKMTEAQFNLIKSGISAASSHNMQPWKIAVEDDRTFTLFADLEKDLPVIDGNRQQMLISQGTFIEKVKQAANAADLDMNVSYATIDLTESIPKIATFSVNNSQAEVPDVVTGSTYDRSNPESDDLQTIFQNEFETSSLDYLYIEGDDLPAIQSILRQGNEIESKNQDAMEELLENFRFSKWDKNKTRYGLSLNTMSPLLQSFINPILRFTTTWESFGKSSLPVFEERLENEVGYLLLIKEQPENKDFILAGETLTRLSGKMNGYAIRPAVQVLEDIEGMETLGQAFQASYGSQGEVLLVIGISPRSDGYYEFVRHQVVDLIIPSIH